DPGLLEDLAGHGLLERFADLDEAGERAVEAPREPGVSRQERLAAAVDEHDDRGADARIGVEAALRAMHEALAGHALGGRGAAAAEAMRVGPVDDLRGARRHRERRLAEDAVERAQLDDLVTGREIAGRPGRRNHRAPVARADEVYGRRV